MLLFRIICAFFVAWAMNWAVNRPEAAVLQQDFPELLLIAPLAGAFVGYSNLARRQGWGFVVAVANGVWAGVMCLGLSMMAFVGFKVLSQPQGTSFDSRLLLRLLGEYTADTIDALADFRLIVVVLGATAAVSVITEVIHWALVHIRKARGVKERNTRRAHRPSMY